MKIHFFTASSFVSFLTPGSKNNSMEQSDLARNTQNR